VAQPGGQPGRLNHASDDKEAKRVARGMIQMVAEINGRHLPGVGREVTERTRVTCATCHGGVRKPKALEFEVLDAYEAHGLDSAITRYKELREDYYGRSAYDFSDASLLSAASTIARDSARRGDALSLLRLNLEVNPQSWQSHQQIGQLLERSGDLPGALAAYDKALEVNPRAPRFLRAMRDSLQARIQRRP
jgi:tetratricopeptide (TPR) repeat protein